MRSRQLQTSLTELFGATSAYLRAELAAGAEVPFELGAQSARRGRGGTPLYTYHALTGQFIGERDAAIKRLPGHADAAKLLEHFDGLDRYLASVGGDAARAKGRTRVRAAVKALLEEVFEEQTDFELRPERVQQALERLQNSTLASASDIGLVATLHGVAIASDELALTKGLRIAQCHSLAEVPDDATAPADADPSEPHLVVAYATEQDDVAQALGDGRAVLRDLLSALRLFGDGRVTFGALAWVRVGAGPWNPIALGAGGRPHGMLVVTAEQEDELRAFCNLVSRRAPHENDLAWALRRFELGCERDSPFEALTDNLLALRALLEPEGPASGRLAGRVAAICATPEQRAELTERMTRAIALERSLVAGTAKKDAASRALVDDVANHLRSLLRDVICGHLDPDLAVIADELLEPDELLHSGEPEIEPAPSATAYRAPATSASPDASQLDVGELEGQGFVEVDAADEIVGDREPDAALGDDASFEPVDEHDRALEDQLDYEAELSQDDDELAEPQPEPELGDLQPLAYEDEPVAQSQVPDVEPRFVAAQRRQSPSADEVAESDSVTPLR